jgi:hypothetical protein
MRDEEMLAENRDFLEGFNLSRDVDRRGPGGYVVEPAWLDVATIGPIRRGYSELGSIVQLEAVLSAEQRRAVSQMSRRLCRRVPCILGAVSHLVYIHRSRR